MHKFITLFLGLTAIGMFGHGLYKGRGHHRHRHFGHSHGVSGLSADYYAYTSHLRTWSPSFKALFSLLCLVMCIAMNNIYVSVMVILAMGYLTVVIGGLEFDSYLSMLAIPAAFLLFGSAAVAVGFSLKPAGQYHFHVLNLFYIYCSRASLLKAGNLILKAFGAVSCLYMLTLTTPLSEIISVLRKAHVPSLLSELMNMIYRYIFIMLDTHSRMKNSAQARLGYVDFKTSCYSFGQVAGNLLIVSLKRGNDYYNALEARCYDGCLRFLEEEKPVKSEQIAGAAAFVLLLCGIRLLTG